MSFKDTVHVIADRGDEVSPLLPGANWIGLKGHFTPDELRAIADEIERVAEERKDGDKNRHFQH